MKVNKKFNISPLRMKRQLLFLFIIFISLIIILGAKIVYLNRTKSDEYGKAVLSQQILKETSSDELVPKRGKLIDRNGITLAESVKVYNVIYDPGLLKESSEEKITKTNEFLSENLEGVSNSQLVTLLSERSNSHYEVIARELEYNDIINIDKAIKSKEIIGVFLEDYYKRIYPYNNMASNTIGFVNNSVKGTYGLEEYYDNYLRGTYGRLFGYIDNEKVVNQEEIPAIDGYNITLTLDYNIQKHAEDAINNFLQQYEAKGVHIISMNPSNGEILAMASYPNFNLNEPYNLNNIYNQEYLNSLSQEEVNEIRYNLWKNFLVTDTYEPGSTYKPFVIAAALEEGIIDENTEFVCNGYKYLYGHTIRCWKDEGHGSQNYVDALVNSCNVALMDIGDMIGKDIFYNYQRKFGFGSKTEVDLLGEEDGLLNSYENIGPVELATSSFGQGFNVTPIQLITAFSSLINGGYLYEPYIMKNIVDTDGKLIDSNEPKIIRQVISKETSTKLVNALEKVVSDGTGRSASIEGYYIGGKTGTAEKGNRDLDNYIVSFIGFAPIYDPKIITLVIVDEPNVEIAESKLSADIFADMMKDVLPYYYIYPEMNN